MYNFKKISPKFLYKISNMELRARLVVDGFLTGLHRSPNFGFNVEFAEHREYTPGDDIKYLDWKIYGKRDKFYLKRFEEETNMRVWLVLDKSKSMSYRHQDISKFDYGRFLCASLSYLMLKQSDAVGLVCFSDVLEEYIPPRCGLSHIRHILSTLEKVTPSSNTNVYKSLNLLSEKIKKRGLIVVLSDFLDKEERVIQGLSHFRYKKNEVVVFQILDRAETELPYFGSTTFVDMETKKLLSVDSNLIKITYQNRVKNYLEKFKTKLYQNYIDYNLLLTSRPFDEALLSYLIKRKKCGR